MSRKTQSGQVIILMAFGMMALLAVLGLAIDGGRLFYLERDAQNAADAAVIAATHALCIGDDPVAAGLTAAQANGFFTDGATMTVTVNNPPSQTLDSPLPADTFAEIIINAEIPSYFIHLVYPGDLAVTTYSLGHCIEGWDANVDGRAVMATHSCSDCNNVISFTGSENNITGGLATNGDIQSQGSDHEINGQVDYGPSCQLAANNLILTPNTAGNPNELDEPFTLPEFYHIEDYQPGGARAVLAAAQTNRGYSLYWDLGGDGTGKTSINLNNNATRDRYAAGGIIYYNGDLDIIGNFCNPKKDGAGCGPDPLTIVATGNIHFTGSSNNLRAYDNNLLVFSTVGNEDCKKSEGVDMSGSATQWQGVIYVPHAHVQIPGSEAIGYGVVIADTVKIPGSYNEIVYMPSYLPVIPPSIEVTE